jgi:hypothetical protein
VAESQPPHRGDFVGAHNFLPQTSLKKNLLKKKNQTFKVLIKINTIFFFLKPQISFKNKNWPKYKLHPLSLVKVQFNTLNFDRFNSVL